MAQANNKFEYSKLNSLAVVSMASAITLLGAPAAVLTGHIALGQLRDSGQKGRWMAIVGLVLGYAAIGLGLIAVLFNVFMRVRHGHGFMHDDDYYHHCYNWQKYDYCYYDDIRPTPMPLPDNR